MSFRKKPARVQPNLENFAIVEKKVGQFAQTTTIIKDIVEEVTLMDVKSNPLTLTMTAEVKMVSIMKKENALKEIKDLDQHVWISHAMEM